MNKRGKIRYVLASGNTSAGYQSFLPAIIDSLARVYILKGAPGSGRSTFIRQAGLALCERGFDVEFYVCPLNASSLEGVVFPQLATGIVNGSLPCPVEPRYPGVTGDIINLGEHWDREKIVTNQEEIQQLVNEMEKDTGRAYSLLREAELAKEKLKGNWLPDLDLERLDALVQKLAKEILDGQPGERHFFGSTVSSQGLVSFIDELSEHCRKRYILKGPPGSGKSTVLAAIGTRAAQRGYLVEYYHNGLNPDSLDMVIITNLQVALIDGEGINLSAGPYDTIIDTGECVDLKPGDDNAPEINDTRRTLESLLLDAAETLRDAESHRKRLQKLYTRAMDFSEVDRIRARVLEEILRK